jgi:hypothetical protein
MALRRCDNGHYYDESKYSNCPNCGIRDLNIGTTKPLGGGSGSHAEAGATLPPEEPTRASFNRDFGNAAGSDNRTRRPNERRPEQEPGATQAFWKKKLGIDPVVGWLVCIDGHDKGRDYRIRSERNSIGRAPSMQICIDGDETISRENHTAISFNPKKNTFRIYPGEGRGLVYLNDEEVTVPTELKPYDIIELGQTKLMFVPFCGEHFQWGSTPPET